MGTLDTVHGYTVFLDRTKFGITMRNRNKVLEIGNILELLYEATSTKKMRALMVFSLVGKSRG